MATYVPPKRAVAFTFYVALTSRASRPQLQAAPTLAAGDVKVSKDGGAFANLTTLPAVTPAAGTAVKVDLSATEMTADQVFITFIDAAGAEWDDLAVNIQTAARQIDDLTFPNTSGRGLDVDATGGVEITTGQSVATVTGSVGSIATGGIVAASFAAGAIDAAAIATDAIGSAELAASAVTEIQAGLSTLDAAGVRAAVGLAAANLDTQLTAIDDFIDTEVAAILAAVDTEVAAIKAKTDNLPAAPAAVGDIPTSAANAAALLDLADGIEVGLTPRNTLRLIVAAVAAKLSGGGTATEVIRNAVADTKNRISATVDADGNRTAITYDLT